MSKRSGWRWAFLGLTVVVLVMEGVAAWDGNDHTDPWTDLLVEYVPGEVIFAMIGALMLWLPVHFGIRILRKRKAEKEIE